MDKRARERKPPAVMEYLRVLMIPRKEPVRGDLIVFWKGSDTHWGLYVGGGNMIHVSGEPAGASAPPKFLVKEGPLSAVAAGRRWRVNNRYDKTYKPRDVEVMVKDAKDLVGEEIPSELRSGKAMFFYLRYGSPPQEELKPGDLIEIFRGLFCHWAVYMGDGMVSHLTVPNGVSGSSMSSVPSVHSKNGEIKTERLSTVVGGDKYCINNKYDRKFGRRDVEEILQDAKATEGQQVDYSLFSNNCEHYATKLCHGVRVSEQVDTARNYTAVGGGVVGVLGIIGTVALALSGNQKSLQRR